MHPLGHCNLFIFWQSPTKASGWYYKTHLLFKVSSLGMFCMGRDLTESEAHRHRTGTMERNVFGDSYTDPCCRCWACQQDQVPRRRWTAPSGLRGLGMTEREACHAGAGAERCTHEQWKRYSALTRKNAPLPPRSPPLPHTQCRRPWPGILGANLRLCQGERLALSARRVSPFTLSDSGVPFPVPVPQRY